MLTKKTAICTLQKELWKAFGVIFLFLIVPVFSIAQKEGQASKIILQNKIVRFEFDPIYGGLVSMVDLSSGIDHMQAVNEKRSLWNLNFSFGTNKRTLSSTELPLSRSTVIKLADGGDRATFEWSNLEWALEKVNKRPGVKLGVVSVKVTVDLPRDTGIASWRIWVDNNSDMWSLNEVDFPSLNGFLQAGQYDIAKPWRPGLLYKACREKIFGDYRGNDMPMQFLCATKEKSSVYMATHDTLGWWKSFTLEPGKSFFIKTYAENMGVVGNDHKDPFPIMLGVYRGGWMEGCKIYRKFVQTAPWLAKGKLSQRKDVPQAIKNMGLWLEMGATVKWPGITPKRDAVKPEGKKNPVLLDHLRMQRYFEVPLGVHWIEWTKSVYDTKYPHFFPEKDGIIEPIKNLVSKGFTIMPHINGRLADTFNDDYNEYNPYATKDPFGKPYIELYGPLRGRMAVMCPYTKFWQDKIAELVGQLGTRLGANAAYLDQVSASSPALCFDKSHGHPLGGGHWWVDGYRELLKKVRVAAHENGRDMVIGSESALEQYIDLIDGFYEMEFDGRGIPMMQAVYSGYTLYLFSCYLSLGGNTDRGWKMLNGRSFIWGKQNGWVSFDILKPEYTSRAEYLKKIGKYRVATKKFLTYGELVDTIGYNETVTEIWDVKGTLSTAKLPAIQGAVWKAEDGSLGVFLVNYLDTEKNIDLDIDPRRYGLNSASGQFVVRQVNPEGNPDKAERLTGALKRTEKLAPFDIRVLEISVKK
jgi:hypothetical protein